MSTMFYPFRPRKPLVCRAQKRSTYQNTSKRLGESIQRLLQKSRAIIKRQIQKRSIHQITWMVPCLMTLAGALCGYLLCKAAFSPQAAELRSAIESISMPILVKDQSASPQADALWQYLDSLEKAFVQDSINAAHNLTPAR